MGMGFFEELEKKGVSITPEQKKTIEERFTNSLQYEPVIGLFGKTGVGKSSLCNALFGENICEISDIKACTRDTKKVVLDLGGKGLTLLDVPGVGESNDRDEEYAELYAKLLPELDLVLWILKADDRAFSTDEKFYENIVKPHITQGKPFYFVINQVDKMEPFREWDFEGHKPGDNQSCNIERKIEAVAQVFKISRSKVLAISAMEKYNLVNLIDTIVFNLPGAKRVTLYNKVPKENRSKEQETYARDGLSDEIRQIIREELGERAAEESNTVIFDNPGFIELLWDGATSLANMIPGVGGFISNGMKAIKRFFKGS